MPDIVIDVHENPMPAYLAAPDEPYIGGVVVIPEIFGLNAVMRATTDAFAEAGFIAVCPDLFWRLGPVPELTPGSDEALAQARERAARLEDDQVLDDLRAAVTHVRDMEQSNGRVGAVGYCLGGRFAFLMACRADTQCNVIYYGTRIEQHLDEAKKLTRPLMLHIAGEDQFVPPDVQARIRDRLCPIGGVTIHTYPGVGHGFARKGVPGGNEEAAALADRRTVDFLRLHLR